MAAGIALIVALALCLLLVPLVRRVGRQRGWLAWPREDRWNRQPVPTMGGIAIFTAALGGVLAAYLLKGRIGSLPWGLLAGALVIFIIGVIDDLKALSPQAKLVGEIIAATLAISAGVVTNFFTPRIANPNLAQLFNILLT
jgi:UDP-GlcNAc:undecaprenyl-phosphate GlcNAc-1-phosphate transferase